MGARIPAHIPAAESRAAGGIRPIRLSPGWTADVFTRPLLAPFRMGADPKTSTRPAWIAPCGSAPSSCAARRAGCDVCPSYAVAEIPRLLGRDLHAYPPAPSRYQVGMVAIPTLPTIPIGPNRAEPKPRGARRCRMALGDAILRPREVK